MPVVNLRILLRADGFQKRRLTLVLPWVVAHPGGEILREQELLARLQQVLHQQARIEPVIPAPTLGPDTKIEVESVDISDHPLHTESSSAH